MIENDNSAGSLSDMSLFNSLSCKRVRRGLGKNNRLGEAQPAGLKARGTGSIFSLTVTCPMMRSVSFRRRIRSFPDGAHPASRRPAYWDLRIRAHSSRISAST